MRPRLEFDPIIIKHLTSIPKSENIRVPETIKLEVDARDVTCPLKYSTLYLTYTDLLRRIQKEYPTAHRATVLKRLRKMVEHRILRRYDSGTSKLDRRNRTFYSFEPDEEREPQCLNSDEHLQQLKRKSEQKFYHHLASNRHIGRMVKSSTYQLQIRVTAKNLIARDGTIV